MVHLCVVVDRGYVGWHGRRWGKDRRRVEQAGEKREVEIREPHFAKSVPVVLGEVRDPRGKMYACVFEFLLIEISSVKSF